jgi:hypothetical protein
MNEYSNLIKTAIVLAVIAGSFFYGNHVGATAEKLKAEEFKTALHDVEERAAQGAASEISKIQIVQKNIYNKLEKETHEKLVYTECKHTPDGLLLLNNALENRGDSTAQGVVPKVDGPPAK